MNKAIPLILAVVCLTSGGIVLSFSPGTNAEDLESIDVFMIAGQSNGAYSPRSIPEQADPVCAPGVAYYFGSEISPVGKTQWDSDAQYGIYDMTNPDGTAHIGGIEQPFAYTYNKATGHKICIINVAVPGAKIVEWYLGTENYAWAQEVFAKAVSALEENYTVHVKGLIWIQGEADPTWMIHAYQNRFMTIFNTMSHDTDQAYFNDDYQFENCIISLVRQHRGQYTCISQIQLDATQEKVKLGCIVCDTFNLENGLLYHDDTHYTQKGRNIVGVDLANSYVSKFL